jgi:S-adenosylmethionine:tRNA-ribosyltransferase-isomerase (queuine synthetase)
VPSTPTRDVLARQTLAVHVRQEKIRAPVDERAAHLVNRAPRVIDVGSMVVRALQTAAAGDGHVQPTLGWSHLRLGPGSSLRAVDAEHREALTPPQSSIGLTGPMNAAAAPSVQRSPRGPR